MRRAIARRMVESKSAAPHFYVSTEIDMKAVLSLVEATNEGRAREDRITVTAFLLRAVAHKPAGHHLATGKSTADRQMFQIGG